MSHISLIGTVQAAAYLLGAVRKELYSKVCRKYASSLSLHLIIVMSCGSPTLNAFCPARNLHQHAAMVRKFNSVSCKSRGIQSRNMCLLMYRMNTSCLACDDNERLDR